MWNREMRQAAISFVDGQLLEGTLKINKMKLVMARDGNS
jgi:hypothetical protein